MSIHAGMLLTHEVVDPSHREIFGLLLEPLHCHGHDVIKQLLTLCGLLANLLAFGF
jgi:hypothetical protein